MTISTCGALPPVGDGEGLGDGDGEGDGCGDGDGLGEADGDGLGEADGDGLGDGEGRGEGEGECPGDDDGDGDGDELDGEVARGAANGWAGVPPPPMLVALLLLTIARLAIMRMMSSAQGDPPTPAVSNGKPQSAVKRASVLASPTSAVSANTLRAASFAMYAP